MNNTTTVVLSLLCASAAATGVTLLLRPAAETSPGDTNTVAELRRAVDELRASNTALQGRIDALANVPASASAPVAIERTTAPVVSTEQLAAAVDAYMQQRNGTAALPADGGKPPEFDLDTEIGQLASGNYWSNTDAWKKAFAAGRMDDVIARFEELAQKNPNDVKTQMNLANAYMAYLQMDQSKWQMSMKADAVFDKVLALDNTHWEARFT
ncbi:MAG TPA: hypothetical protein VFZ65_00920, partial [Planctomycetota bacterium]|nr:hypothetical protein [Planctomycetota bacterium]